MAQFDEKIYYNGNYVDLGIQTVNTFSDLATVSHRFVGMTIIVKNVINNVGYPVEVTLVDDVTNSNWKCKIASEFPNYQSLIDKCNEIIDSLKITKRGVITYPKNFFYIGSEVVIQKDETNDNKLSKYWLVDVTDDCEFIWERKRYAEDVDTTDITEDIKALKKLLNTRDDKYGNVVYSVSGTLYSYVDDTEGLIWTDDTSEIPEGKPYNSYQEGLYVVIKNEDGSKSLKPITTADISGEDAE